jgi:transcriptional regulator with XRE-family HTH domain
MAMEKRFENAKYRHSTKLSMVDIEQIRWLWVNRDYLGISQRELACSYGVTRQQISNIVKRRQWKDVRRMLRADTPPEVETMPERWVVEAMEIIESYRVQESYETLTVEEPQEIGQMEMVF